MRSNSMSHVCTKIFFVIILKGHNKHVKMKSNSPAIIISWILMAHLKLSVNKNCVVSSIKFMYHTVSFSYFVEAK